MSTQGSTSKAILIISGCSLHRETIRSIVWDCGWHPVLCGTAKDARELLAANKYAAVFCDDVLPDADFRSLVRHVAQVAPSVPVIVVSRRDEWDAYLIALASGATDYLAFPPYAGEVEQCLSKATKLARSLATAA